MNASRPLRLLGVSFMFLGFARLGAITAEEWAEQIFTAQSRSQPLPAVGATERDATEFLAYRVQRALNDLKIADGDKVIGHKAGLTSMAAQNKFGMIEPVSGTLFESQKKNTATFVSLRQFKGMVVEMELGFELKLSIRQAPESIEELQAAVRQVVPVVELPNIYFTPDVRLTGADLIASNVAASTVIVGRGKSIDGLDLSTIEAELKRDNEIVSEGKASDAMGDPWKALMWLVRQRLQQGFEVKRNDILITGALGKVVEAERGRYVADFGKLGRVTFTMR